MNRPELSNIYDYIVAGTRCTLVEPEPDSIKRIQKLCKQYKNITLYPVAAYDFNGELELSQRHESTYVSEIKNSPAVVNDGYVPVPEDRFTARAVTFDAVDDGTIDLLSIDVEGSEWFVIKHMTSRPSVISVETHGKRYTNPHLEKIRTRMADEGYALWYKDKTDSVFVKKGSIAVSLLDRLHLLVTDLYLKIRMLRKGMRSRSR